MSSDDVCVEILHEINKKDNDKNFEFRFHNSLLWKAYKVVLPCDNNLRSKVISEFHSTLWEDTLVTF